MKSDICAEDMRESETMGITNETCMKILQHII